MTKLLIDFKHNSQENIRTVVLCVNYQNEMFRNKATLYVLSVDYIRVVISRGGRNF